jgi:hypothetical protein
MAEEPNNVGEAGTPPADADKGAVVVPPKEPSERPILPGQEIVYPNDDGSEGVAKVEDMIASHKKLQAGGSVDPKDLKEFQMWMGAKTGDPAKVAEYARSLIPTAEPPKPEVVIEGQQKTIEALQTDVEELKKVIAGEVQPITNQLRSVTELQSIAAEVKKRAGDLPHLARLAEKKGPMVAAQAIRNKRPLYEEAARREGMTLAQLPSETQGEILTKMFADVEKELTDLAAVYGEPLTKTEIKPGSPAPVNDQRFSDSQPDHIPARIQIGPDGRRLDGAPPAGSQPPGEQPPAVPVVPASGGAPGMQPDQGQRPFTLEAMKEKLQADRERMAGVV